MSLTAVKSRSLRLRKRWRVRGAEGEEEVRRRMEWSLIWDVNLLGGREGVGREASIWGRGGQPVGIWFWR